MKNFRVNKKIATLAILSVLIAVVFCFFDRENKIAVQAGTGDNVSGFAWSENLGWVSFNSKDCDVNGNDFVDKSKIPPADGSSGTFVGEFSDIVIGSDGFPVISYYDNSGKLMVLHCRDNYCSLLDSPIIIDSGNVGKYASIVIGSDGFPVISYFYNNTAIANRRLKFIHCTSFDCSTHDSPLILDSSTGGVGEYTSIVIGSDGFPVISYVKSYLARELAVAHCDNLTCSSAGLFTVDVNSRVYSTNIVKGANGFPVISYFDWTSSSLKVAHCGNIDCSNPAINVIATIKSTGQSSPVIFNSISIGSDGKPIISYYNNSNYTLGTIYCGGSNCADFANNINTVIDSMSNVGEFNSITMGANGFPAISYYNKTSYILKFVRCTNSSCSSRDTPITIDSEGKVGRFSSIAITSDGNPLISYFDDDKYDLKVAKCLESDCSRILNYGCDGDDSTMVAFDYGINIVGSGNFSGYAWGSGVGWISFQENSAPPDNYAFNSNCLNACDNSNNCTACYNYSNGNVFGWAKILSLGDDGWVKLSDDSIGFWNGKGIKIDSATGDFSGWAWNGNNTGAGIGWVSFNCSDADSCAASAYKVRAAIPAPPSNLTANPLNCNSMQLNWTDNSNNETGFQAQYSSDGINNWNDFCYNPLNPNIVSCASSMPENTAYYFRVKALGAVADSAWYPASGGISGSTSYCLPVLSSNSSNCDQIILNWTYNGTDNYKVFRKKDAEASWSEIATGLTAKSYTDTNNISSNSTYQYYVRAETEGLDSFVLGSVKPCPKLPTWKEVKPN